jgi:hypothetical protein
MPARSTCTIDGTKFRVMDAEFRMDTKSDSAGMAVMGTFESVISVVVDLNDTQNIPFGTIKKLFDLGNVVVRDKIKDCKIEFWDGDDEKNCIVTYKCKAWISSYRTSNVPRVNGQRTDNHLLYLELKPVINKENYQEVTISN